MLCRMLAVFAVCLFVAGSALAAGEQENDSKALQGVWQIVEVERDGKREPPKEIEKAIRLSFQGDELIMQEEGKDRKIKAKFKLDPSKTPKTIDLIPDDGPGKDKAIAGIYVVENGQLRINAHDAIADVGTRPKEFKTQAGDRMSLLTLERVKPK